MYDYYRSDEWQKIKQAAIDASGGKCEFCGSTAETAHHVKYPKTLGTEEPHELIAVCWRCHGLMHGRRLTQHQKVQAFDTPKDAIALGLCSVLHVSARLVAHLTGAVGYPDASIGQFHPVVKLAGLRLAEFVLRAAGGAALPPPDELHDNLLDIDTELIDVAYEEWCKKQSGDSSKRVDANEI